jgi:hypothetical protein
MKARICPVCTKTLGNQIIYAKFPCGCIFCSKICFDGYFKMVFKNKKKSRGKLNITIEIICICGYQFNNNDLKQIHDFFEKSKMKDNKKIIEKIITHNFMTVCFLCLNDVRSAGDTFCQVKYGKDYKHVYCESCNESTEIRE